MEKIDKKIRYCMKITGDCLGKAEALDKQGALLMNWAKSYFSDAEFYLEKKDKETALEAVAYAHGFIDSGVLLGHIKIKGYYLERELI
ncbi:MAG: DUF357 domain-containing protein [Candidatus Micrarchaeota archaeon]